MAPERITITIRPSTGDDGSLSVADGLRQVLDFFDLLSAAQGGGDGEVVSWRLVAISKSSPLSATAEAYATMTGVAPEIVARRGKARVADALSAITTGERPPNWLEGIALTKARMLLERNLNGIGRTDIDFERPEQAPTIIVERSARIALNTIDRMELEKRVATEDLSHNEMGSLEGTVAGVTTYYGKPAVHLRESLRGDVIICALSDDAASELKATRNWGEVWEGQRVLVAGEIVYRKDGRPSRINNATLTPINARPINYDEIMRPGMLGGLTPRAYLDSVWEDDDG